MTNRLSCDLCRKHCCRMIMPSASPKGGEKGIIAFRAVLAEGRPFDAVFTDLGMPHVDGRRVAAAIKEAAPYTPVLLLTGGAERYAVEGDKPLGIDCMLSKPPKVDEIRLALASLTGDRVPSAPAPA